MPATEAQPDAGARLMAAGNAPARGSAAHGLLRVNQRHGHRQGLSRCQAQQIPAAAAHPCCLCSWAQFRGRGMTNCDSGVMVK